MSDKPAPPSKETQLESIHKDHRKRQRQLFLQHGGDVFRDYELLELLLFYSIPRKDVNTLAHTLLNHFHSFDRMMDATVYELMQVPGVGENTAILLNLVSSMMQRYQVRHSSSDGLIRSVEDAAEYIRPHFFGTRNEKLLLLCLDNRGKVVYFNKVSEGSFNATSVDLHLLTAQALTHGAASVVLAHNHTSGSPLPSNADLEATRVFIRALASVNITLFDHLIFADSEYSSMRASRILQGFR